MEKKVLIVDDSKSARRELNRILSEARCKCFEEENGKEALRLLETVKDVSLIICDTTMPVMNGREFVEALRSDQKSQHIEVIMIAPDAQSQESDAYASLGVRSWLQKPLQSKAVLALVRSA